MIKLSNLTVSLSDTEKEIKTRIAKKLQISEKEILAWHYLKKSVDARKKNDIHFILTVAVTVKQEEWVWRKNSKEKNISPYEPYHYAIPAAAKDKATRPVVVGFGPAGMFAALLLAKAGLRPIVLERGAAANERRQAVERFRSTGLLDPETNVQFGEGGAGTFSDGKLNTGTHDSRIQYVLESFVAYGAPEEILYQAKPHIGTDYLFQVVQNIRHAIESYGGEVYFGAKFCDYELDSNGFLQKITYVKNEKYHEISTNSCILATGHSARDVFQLLYQNHVLLEQKNFAMGVRIEHTQEALNRCMYGAAWNHPALGAADYKLAVHLPNNHSLYTFCMCPGGEVMASASEEGRLVVNGMSYHARDGVNANSALLVGISPQDLESTHPLAGMFLQQDVERKAFLAGGGTYAAPTCLVGDFLEDIPSNAFRSILPTYRPGTKFAMPQEYLPAFMVQTLRLGIPEMSKKISIFRDPDAILTGVESRSSSPVRIVRDKNFQSVNIKGMYPCGEGAGYAGGITSAAVDGLKCAEALIQAFYP